MEAKAGNLILDFETLFSDFQEISNGSSLTDLWFPFFLSPGAKAERLTLCLSQLLLVL